MFIRDLYGSMIVLKGVGFSICSHEKRIFGKYIFVSQIGIFLF